MAESTTSITQSAASWSNGLKNYVEDLRKEMRLVTWPSWKQVRATTAVVIFATFAFSAYFFAVDAVIARIINKLFEMFAPK